jgi:stage V sporulation protein SpoVS
VIQKTLEGNGGVNQAVKNLITLARRWLKEHYQGRVEALLIMVDISKINLQSWKGKRVKGSDDGGVIIEGKY